MIVYIAVDDENGMMFNNRRQSQDRIMRQNMLKDCGDSKLWIAEYSRKLFTPIDDSEFPCNIVVNDEFLSLAEENDYCFVENQSITEWADKIDTLVLYKWNKSYPADFYFDPAVLTNMKRFAVSKFTGSSHDKITKEVWKRAK